MISTLNEPYTFVEPRGVPKTLIFGENDAKQPFLAVCQMITMRLTRKTEIYFEDV